MTHIYIDQSTTANIPAIKEQWILDWQEREQKDAALGPVKSKSRWSKLQDVDDTYLKEGNREEGEVVEAYVESTKNGWKGRQVSNIL